MQTIFIKPAKDNLIIRDPISSTPLAKAGETKPHNAYWSRRLKDGDVVKTTKPKKETRSTASRNK